MDSQGRLIKHSSVAGDLLSVCCFFTRGVSRGNPPGRPVEVHEVQIVREVLYAHTQKTNKPRSSREPVLAVTLSTEVFVPDGGLRSYLGHDLRPFHGLHLQNLGIPSQIQRYEPAILTGSYTI